MIRAATSDDAEAVAAVHRAAFEGEDEARLAREVPADISLVAEEDGAVVGHVHLSRAHVGDEPVLALGPIGVVPACRRRGVGSALMAAAIAEADRRGEPLIGLLGHPEYYPRFGFRPSRELGIEPPFEVGPQFFMVLPLAAYRPELRGEFRYHPAFG